MGYSPPSSHLGSFNRASLPGWPGRDVRRAGMEEAGASHASSVDSGSKAGGSDASAGKRAGAGSTRIQADGRSSRGCPIASQSLFLIWVSLHYARLTNR